LEVTLVWHTPDPEFQCALAARRCYSSKPYSELVEELRSNPARVQELLRRVIDVDKALDVIEHAVFMFHVEGLSRVTSHQLVRHRHFSFDQTSQRVVNVLKEDFIIPEDVKKDPELLEEWKNLWEHSKRVMEISLQKGIKKQDIRYASLQGSTTELVFTANARALMHFFYLRCSKEKGGYGGAQWEIQELADKMLDKVVSVCPTIFAKIVES